MESNTLIPLPPPAVKVSCDVCGKLIAKYRLKRHAITHARVNPNDAIVEKLRIRCRQRVAELFAIVTEWDNVDDKPELRDVAKLVRALHADLDVLGVI